MSEVVSRSNLADETARLQNRASDPAYSVWVSANAGSGKTHVLTQRVIRLMLSGTRPSSILCLTYTKAAASEMSNRVFERLSHWTALEDEELAREIAIMEGALPNRIKLMEARKLFARALESPGGLKIQTIHAFCESLLHQFPLEANVAGHFNVLDDKAAASLLAEARRNLLTATQAEADGSLARAFHEVLGIADESGLNRLLADIIQNRTGIGRFLDYARSHGGYEPVLADALGLPRDASLESIARRVWPLPGLSPAAMRDYIDLANTKGGAKVHATSYNLALAMRTEDPVERLMHLRATFLKQDETPYSDQSFGNKEMRNCDPGLCDAVQLAKDYVHLAWQEYKTVRLFEATLSALTLAERLIENYEQLKKERSFLDFEDFITRTEALLRKDEIGPWVHYKLDQGIDHILVDEAQDTSPQQWEIIRSLTEEFFSGEGARQLNRTIFAVGDEKQSIYSFQGARPERFADERRVMEQRAREGGRDFEQIPLRVSFRSTEDVLTAVDQVFAEAENVRGLSAEHDAVIHVSNRAGQAGSVDIWETIAEEMTSDEDEDWLAPFDRLAERSAPAELARRMALVIDAMVGKESLVLRDGTVRAIRPGDILVLVRKRDAFVQALSRELKRIDRVPVAGTDRLRLSSHIAVQDLLALGRFVLLTEDDLALAGLIKSPLFNLDEDALREACIPRNEAQSVWQRINELAETHTRWRAVCDSLNRWRRMARTERPYDFYSCLLGHEGARALFLARFGVEVSDVLDEFLTFALDHEQAGLPGLAAFVSTLETDSPEIKREQDKGRDEVRIMTVHASKGLEAPVVFLVDSGGKPFEKTLISKLRLTENPNLPIAVPVWYPSREFMDPTIASDDGRLERAAEEEYRRLLYVGMTRASDRLILCSYRKKRDIEGTWAKLTQSALSASGERCQPATFRLGSQEWQGWKWRSNPVPPPAVQQTTEPVSKPDSELPRHLFRPLAESDDLPRPLAPSGAHVIIDEEEGNEIVGSLLFKDRKSNSHSQIRGKIIHRLLQTLPEFDAGERASAAFRYLSRSVPSWKDEERNRVAQQVFDILSDPKLAFLHHEKTQAEVSIMGTIELGGKRYAVSGRIDRIGEIDNDVFILDYKTNLSPPERATLIPFAHRAQLALYRQVLKSIFPTKHIHCLLLYTEGPHLYSLDEGELEKALLDISPR